MKKTAVALAFLGAASLAVAAEQVGELRDVQGNVTVTSASGVVKGVAGTPLTATSRILIGNGGKATVMLTEGCVIPLKANQFLALDPKLVCTQQVAAVSQLAAPYRVAQAPVGGGALLGGGAAVGTGTSLLVVGGIVAGAVVVNEAVSNDLSGN
jgi:hypothetical protein